MKIGSNASCRRSNTSGISCAITNEHIHELLDLAGFEEVNTVYSGSFQAKWYPD